MGEVNGEDEEEEMSDEGTPICNPIVRAGSLEKVPEQPLPLGKNRFMLRTFGAKRLSRSPEPMVNLSGS
jgi:hypothetical protein